MSNILTLAFLFFIGSCVGWVIEVFFRRFVSKENPQRKWVNPGAFTGPWLPIYGFGLCILYLIASLENFRLIQNPFWNKAALFAAMAVCMTAIEYIGGFIAVKYYHVWLWDYRNMPGNIQGIICPQFSFIWAVMGAVYYFLIHPYILDALSWLSQNLAFSFFIGMFYGIFLIDVCHTLNVMNRLKEFADRDQLELKYEAIKEHIRHSQEAATKKNGFFRSFRSERPLMEHLKEMRESFESRRKLR